MQNGSPTPPPRDPDTYVEEVPPPPPPAEGYAPNSVADTLTEAAWSVLNDVLALL